MMDNENTWPKKITVDKRIVKILSQSTYENFPNALKEIITNSYDADASLVNINIDTVNEVISIEDNGKGMSQSDFDIFLRIAGFKREKSYETQSGRKIIGKFGIGFLSSFAFFNNFSIQTKISGSPQIVFADIPCYKYFSSIESNISAIPIYGGIRENTRLIEEQFTKITLKGFSPLAKSFFHPKRETKPRRNSILNYSPLEILSWQLAEDLPIHYEDIKYDFIFNFFSKNLSFDVLLNGVPLKRKVYGKSLLEITKKPEVIGDIKFIYFIVTNRKAVSPVESRYFKMRNLNVGVGKRTTFGLGTEVGGARSRLHWLSGDVIFIEGMNDLITASRDNFNYNDNFEKIKDFLIKKLTHHSNKLEKESEVIKEIKENIDESKIKNIRLLDPEYLERKISSINNSDIKSLSNTEYFNNLNKSLKRDSSFYGNNLMKSPFSKKISINNNLFHVKLSQWSDDDSISPACRIFKNTIFLNKEYPLFRKEKYADIFIKFHILLLTNYNEGNITLKSFKKILSDFDKFFKDYY